MRIYSFRLNICAKPSQSIPQTYPYQSITEKLIKAAIYPGGCGFFLNQDRYIPQSLSKIMEKTLVQRGTHVALL
jgi:hypothetical protein